MRKNVFKAIADAVAAVPGVAFVDLWNNQVQTLNGGSAFPFAAVFIEFEALEWSLFFISTIVFLMKNFYNLTQ